MDVINDENDEDISFVPKSILDHRIERKPCCEIYESKDKDGTVKTHVKIIREPHLQIQVEWKNGDISWCAADAMQEQKPFIFIPYIHKRKLFNHPHFQWIKKYKKEQEAVSNLFKVLSARAKKASKEPKSKFGIQVPHNHRQSEELDKFEKDTLWSKVVDSEVKSINDHNTFIALEEDKPIPSGYK